MITLYMSPSTQTPPRRRAAKEITIEEEEYEHTHLRTPRGYGRWGFAPTHATRAQRPDGTPIATEEEARDQRAALTIWITGTYAQAKRAAAKIIASQHNAPRYWSTEP